MGFTSGKWGDFKVTKRKINYFSILRFSALFHVLKTNQPFMDESEDVQSAGFLAAKETQRHVFSVSVQNSPASSSTHTHQYGEINWVLEHLVDPGCTDCLTSGTAPDLLTNN